MRTRRAIEAHLLWRIRISAPEHETRTLHRLLRKDRNAALSEAESLQLQTLLDEREARGAQRLRDLTEPAQLRAVSVAVLMDQLGIRPIPVP